jgi:hypothetical protein
MFEGFVGCCWGDIREIEEGFCDSDGWEGEEDAEVGG